MHFFLSLCILHWYLKLIFISQKENKGCSGTQESLLLAELEPQGAALGEPAHTVGCPPVPLTQHDRVSHTGIVTMPSGIYEVSSILSVHLSYTFPVHSDL